MNDKQRTIELTRVVNNESMFNRTLRFTHNGLAFIGLCFMTSGMSEQWAALRPRLAEAASEVTAQAAEKQDIEGSGMGALAWCAMNFEGKKAPKNPEGILIDGMDAVGWCGTYYAKFKQKVEKQLGGLR